MISLAFPRRGSRRSARESSREKARETVCSKLFSSRIRCASGADFPDRRSRIGIRAPEVRRGSNDCSSRCSRRRDHATVEDRASTRTFSRGSDRIGGREVTDARLELSRVVGKRSTGTNSRAHARTHTRTTATAQVVAGVPPPSPAALSVSSDTNDTRALRHFARSGVPVNRIARARAHATADLRGRGFIQCWSYCYAR